MKNARNLIEDCGIEAEETDLTLDEQGLSAVNSFFAGVIQGEQEQHSSAQHPSNTAVWEPPIDNECP